MGARRFVVSSTIVVATVAAVAVAAPAAHAGPPAGYSYAFVEWTDGHYYPDLHYDDRPGSASHLSTRSSAMTVTLDEAYPIWTGPGCTHPITSDLTLVSCVGPFETVLIDASDGDDVIDHFPSTTVVNAFSIILGGPGNDVLVGSDDADYLVGDAGDDRLSGWGGRDNLDGGLGADLMSGGADIDRVLYEDRPNGVVISNNGVTGDDGEPGEGDTINANVENLAGGNGNDIITGNDGDNVLQGCNGSDRLYGNGGNDTFAGICNGRGPTTHDPDLMDGGSGIDTVNYLEYDLLGVTADLDDADLDDGTPGEKDSIKRVENLRGGAGDDVLTGNASDNLIDGFDGHDAIYGSGGNDSLYGAYGNDRIYGGPGLDVLYGGNGTDHCEVGLEGLAAFECES